MFGYIAMYEAVCSAVKLASIQLVCTPPAVQNTSLMLLVLVGVAFAAVLTKNLDGVCCSVMAPRTHFVTPANLPKLAQVQNTRIRIRVSTQLVACLERAIM